MRAFTDHAVTVLAVLATIMVVAPLRSHLWLPDFKGASSLNFDFFTKVPKPPGKVWRRHRSCHRRFWSTAGFGGSVIGVPIGIAGGVYLAEFGRGTKLANSIRFTADVLNGVPSIVMGVAAYALVVVVISVFYPSRDTSPHSLEE